MIDESAELVSRIKERAAQFCADNYRFVTNSDLLVIENAMMIGASVRLQLEQEKISTENDELREQYAELLATQGGVN